MMLRSLIILVFISLFNLVKGQCPDSIRLLNSNYDTFRIYWGNSKPNANNIQLRLYDGNNQIVINLKNDTIFVTNKIKNLNNWYLGMVKYKGNKYNCNQPLPVELIYFKYKDNQLIWTTASETNNHYFLVQKLRDKWVNLDTIYSKSNNGTSTQKLNYKFYINNSGYYRLKQVDFDGSYEYSDIIKVSKEDKLSEYNFYNIKGNKIFRGTVKEFCGNFDKNKLYYYNKNGKVQKLMIK